MSLRWLALCLCLVACKREPPPPLSSFAKRELHLEIPSVGAMSPGLVWINDPPEQHVSADGKTFIVLGTNMAGLWLVQAPDGSVQLVDDAEQELGTKIFDSPEALAAELNRQNPAR